MANLFFLLHSWPDSIEFDPCIRSGSAVAQSLPTEDGILRWCAWEPVASGRCAVGQMASRKNPGRRRGHPEAQGGLTHLRRIPDALQQNRSNAHDHASQPPHHRANPSRTPMPQPRHRSTPTTNGTLQPRPRRPKPGLSGEDGHGAGPHGRL